MLLAQLQDAVERMLLADAFLAEVSIFNVRRGVLENEIDRALALLSTRANGKRGAAIVVEMPALRVPHPALPGPHYELSITLRVQERPLFNLDASTGTGLSAEEIALRCLSVLHQWSPGFVQCLTADEQDALTPAYDDKRPGDVIYALTLRADFPRAVVARAPRPAWNLSGGDYVADAATFAALEALPGAAVYVSADTTEADLLASWTSYNLTTKPNLQAPFLAYTTATGVLPSLWFFAPES